VNRRNTDARAEHLREGLPEFTGQSADATAAALKAHGIPTSRGGRWTARSIIDTREQLAPLTPPITGMHEARMGLGLLRERASPGLKRWRAKKKIGCRRPRPCACSHVR
jgi:hypothetical protein